MKEITWNDFEKVELRAGTIVEVNDFVEAIKPAYQLRIDFGESIGILKSSAQLKALYSKEDLLGKQIVAVINFPNKQIGPFMSECLVTGFYRDNGDVVLTTVDNSVPNGARMG
ncbi:tRNA-binding protein [Pleionea sediminis]|uniref:tRNA-binding protein n=1 Tax=Pleionea sediminis TaxID=2569479 RepID=UPI00118560EE|nr:tRNA-binding protein [Pleionea sediminis]